LKRTALAIDEMRGAYDNYQYALVVSTLQSFVTFLSNVFLDVSKDRLYVDAPDSASRRAAQTVITHVVTRFLAAIAPITPHMAEEAHLALPPGISQTRKKSVFLQGWLETPSEWTDGISETEDLFWQTSSVVRGEVNKCLELARNDKIVGASVEAEAFVFVGDAATRESLQLRSSELAKFFLVSRVAFVDSVEEATKSGSVVRFTGVEAAQGGLTELGVTVGVQKTTGTKCLRCWGYFDSKEMGEDEKHPELCGRCTPIVLSKDPGMDARVVKATMAAKAASEAAAEAAAVEAV